MSNPNKNPVEASDVADALERYLSKIEDSAVHWAKTDGLMRDGKPLYWPEKPDPIIGVWIDPGVSEGTILRLIHQTERYKMNFECLITVKVLSRFERAYKDVEYIKRFIDELDIEKAREGIYPSPAQATPPC